MKQTVDRILPAFPFLGLLLILAGLVSFFVTRRWDLLQNLLVAGGALLLLAFAILQPDAVRELMSGRSVRYGTSTILSILFFSAILILLYYVAYQNDSWRYDTTETAEFTPLPETLELLDSLEEPVHVLAFYPAGSPQSTQAGERLDALQAYSDNISYEFIDPLANPIAAQEYELSPQGTMVFTTRDGQIASESTGLTERAIHTALLKTLNPSEKKIYFLTGHGEYDIEDFSQAGLSGIISFNEDLGFTIETLDLRIAGAVPDDAVMVATVGQQVPMEPAEVDALQSYLANGGSLFVARDLLLTDLAIQERIDADDLSIMLRDNWGIVIRPDLIIDPVSFYAQQPFSPIGAGYGNSPITANELEQFGTVFNLARSIETTDIEGITKVNLITTTEDAWGEASLELLEQNILEPNEDIDAFGPLTLGVSAENAVTEGRVVVFGDTDFLTNSFSGIGGNGLVFSNMLNWVVDDEVIAELTPRETVDRQVVIDQSQIGLLFLISICLAPGIMAAIGISVWYARRNNR
ncbi:MAG: GldG family protein [Chloroflexota bacterium]